MKKELLTRTECDVLRGIAIIGIFLHNYCHWLRPVVQENEYQYFKHNVDWFYQVLHSHWTGLIPFHILSFFGHYGVPVFLFLSANGITVQTLPGATAFVPALVSSGLPCDRFCFEGFLPQKKGRKTQLESLVDETRTMVFYESPYRVVKTLEQFAEVFGTERQVSCCREISKIHEESVRGTLADVIAHFKETEPRGEFVIVVAGKEKVKSSDKNKVNR